MAFGKQVFVQVLDILEKRGAWKAENLPPGHPKICVA
jgi:hypothetical protein